MPGHGYDMEDYAKAKARDALAAVHKATKDDMQYAGGDCCGGGERIR